MNTGGEPESFSSEVIVFKLHIVSKTFGIWLNAFVILALLLSSLAGWVKPVKAALDSPAEQEKAAYDPLPFIESAQELEPDLTQSELQEEIESEPPLVELFAEPEAYLPGEEVTLSWKIGDWSSYSEYEPELALRIPLDFVPVEKPPVEAVQVEENLMFRLPLGLLDKMVVRASEKAEGVYYASMELAAGDKILGQNGVKLVQDSLTLIGPDGGNAVDKSGRVKVSFPANVTDGISEQRQLQVHIHEPTGAKAAAFQWDAGVFEITAEIPLSDSSPEKEAVSQFNQTIAIEVTYDEEDFKGSIRNYV
jgi:hypothetical protein